MTDFNIIKNVNESFSIIVPSGFVELIPPSGTVYAFMKIDSSINVTCDVITTTTINRTITISPPEITMTPEIIAFGEDVYIYCDSSGDCHAIMVKSSTFNSTSVNVFAGYKPSSGDGGEPI
jgi:hypothetical protein